MRIVIKIGTNVLIDSSGFLNQPCLAGIAKDVSDLCQAGHQIALVTSGAVALGKAEASNLSGSRPRKILAAIGQPALMRAYTQCFKRYNVLIGQCLLSRSDFASRELYNNLITILDSFFEAGIIPIMNENDVLAPENLNFGDNDSLSAMLAIAIKADILMLLTDQPGLLTSDPKTNHNAKLISVVTRVDKEVERLCSKEASASGRGGMISKVKAAQQAVFAGITTFITDGRQPRIIADILNGKLLGTRFIACADKNMSEQKRWLMAAKGFGQIIVDEGAARALKSGKSLLLPGVIAVKGLFEQGSIVEVVWGGQTVAYGKVNYGHKDLQQALASRKAKASHAVDKEVIHCDYMVVLK